ncbi:hypothetical protein ACJZ2D_010865 [Fusarium nematophilum]
MDHSPPVCWTPAQWMPPSRPLAPYLSSTPPHQADPASPHHLLVPSLSFLQPPSLACPGHRPHRADPIPSSPLPPPSRSRSSFRSVEFALANAIVIASVPHLALSPSTPSPSNITICNTVASDAES